MIRNELYVEAAKIKKDIQEALYHPYLFKYIQPPTIDDEKLLLLCSITNETNKKIKKETIVSTILVQTAIDIHERILFIDLIKKDHRTRQLTVLAGDYYSSLYYERLTAINAQKLIRLLADAVKEIIELKTIFLYGENISLSELMSIQMKIESNIMNNFSIATIGKEIPLELKQLLLLKKLIQEKKVEENGQHSIWTHLFGRHIHNHVHPDSKEIQLLPIEEYKQTVQTIESLILKKYQQLESKLTNCKHEVILSIFNNQTALLNKSSTKHNVLFSEEG